jgi:hypothetical protein
MIERLRSFIVCLCSFISIKGSLSSVPSSRFSFDAMLREVEPGLVMQELPLDGWTHAGGSRGD